MREQSERDYQLASGISSDVDASDSVFAQTKARIPWLLIGIIGGIVNSLILSGFEARIAAITALAIFIPLIGGTGGNVGVQASAIVVQGLANGRLDIKNAASQIGRECLVAMMNAVVISSVVFFIHLLHAARHHEIHRVVCRGGLAVCRGDIRHRVRHPCAPHPERLKINPALATGPFIQITNDVVGLLIYVGMSTWMLNVFGC